MLLDVPSELADGVGAVEKVYDNRHYLRRHPLPPGCVHTLTKDTPMPRAPFQILVVPFRHVGDQLEFAVLRREDMNVWQAVAGGGEDNETPEQAALREATEELGLDHPTPLYPLQTTASVPARFFADRIHWPAGTYVVPEYSFAIDLTGIEAAISHEHTALEWRDYDTAHEVLRFDSNRTALSELHERLLAIDLPHPVKSDRP
ncbi:NUDIX pyrophosphatase [Streptomyces sp. NPDC005356]|uniref:NUDIX hydrolase n=1 Tax=Streptomyces sp. NPDC005356 TaxID=3157167 RepID=UPI0033BF71C9